MKAKIYSIVHGDISNDYEVEYSSDILVENVEDVIRKAKRHFKLEGKQFTVVTIHKTFYISKIGKKWKTYELLPPQEK